ncbi:hypothetical protein EGW08_016704 [Elysia chlorotica]|nr:hypothetical protein EGW08_016704 [Elysia chlorotica]
MQDQRPRQENFAAPSDRKFAFSTINDANVISGGFSGPESGPQFTYPAMPRSKRTMSVTSSSSFFPPKKVQSLDIPSSKPTPSSLEQTVADEQNRSSTQYNEEDLTEPKPTTTSTDRSPQQPIASPEVLITGYKDPRPIPYVPLEGIERMNIVMNCFPNYVDTTNTFPDVSYAVSVINLETPRESDYIPSYQIVADGHCMFRAISLAVFGTEDEYNCIKKAAFDYGTKHENDIRNLQYFSPDFNLNDLLTEVWGTSESLTIISLMLNVPIYVYAVYTVKGSWNPPIGLDYTDRNPITNRNWIQNAGIYLKHYSNHFELAHLGVGTETTNDFVMTHGNVFPVRTPIPIPSIHVNRVLSVSRRIIHAFLSGVFPNDFKNANGVQQTDTTPRYALTPISQTQLTLAEKTFVEERRLISDVNISEWKLNNFIRPYVKTFPTKMKGLAANERVDFILLKKPYRTVWATINTPQCDVTIIQSSPDKRTGRIQDSSASSANSKVLRVDFANKKIGGGTIRKHGKVQEELLFLSAPECIFAMLLSSRPMDDDEAIYMRNVALYTDYTDDTSNTASNITAVPNETNNPYIRAMDVVAVDATDYKGSVLNQYNKQEIDRDLHKLYVGFDTPDNHDVVRTGFIGAGVFRGDKVMSFLKQLIVCSYLRKKMEFCCYSKPDFNLATNLMKNVKGLDVKTLYASIQKGQFNTKYKTLSNQKQLLDAEKKDKARPGVASRINNPYTTRRSASNDANQNSSQSVKRNLRR